MSSQYGCKETTIAKYTCKSINQQIIIDGNLEKKPWIEATKAPLVDLVTGQVSLLKTEIAALWDKENFYIGFWIDEPNIQATLTVRDSLIYTENDIEIFIGGKDCYYEFQMNALGTIYEVFYVWQDAYTKDSRFNCDEFDLLERDVDVLGGFQDTLRYKKHPRGKRWAFMDWDFPGLKAAVQVQGKINDPSIIDKGWTAEIAFPWKGMKSLFGKKFDPEKEKQIRVNFSRFEKLNINNQNINFHPGWSLNPHNIYDSHIPRCFSIVLLENSL